jgi:hypothetical protein
MTSTWQTFRPIDLRADHPFESTACAASWFLQFLVGDSATVADFGAAYTLDKATVSPSTPNKAKMLDDPHCLRGFMERMYKRPKGPPRVQRRSQALRR